MLQGVTILFSGLIPLAAKPQERPLWVRAERFGARCTASKADEVTHVIAKTGGTEKVRFLSLYQGKRGLIIKIEKFIHPRHKASPCQEDDLPRHMTHCEAGRGMWFSG